MAELIRERKVYSDFFTNLAVAWFSAGIIAPLFTPVRGILKFSASLIAMVACIFSLRLAVLVFKGTK